jgi:hypothetical protein
MSSDQKPADWTQNNLLSHLRPQDLEMLAPHFKMLRVPSNVVLYKQGQNVDTVYFPCGPTLVSFLIDTEDGSAIETTLVGREGAVGGIVSQGHLPAYSRIMVQFGGDFVTLSLSMLEAAKLKSRSVDALFARYADCMVAQIFQATACNAAHSIEQRACKWIGAAMDRTNTTEVPLTQERLSAMLGVGRSYISRVIGTLKRANILRVQRGKIIVYDRTALAERACKCNASIKEHFERVLSGVYPSDNNHE